MMDHSNPNTTAQEENRPNYEVAPLLATIWPVRVLLVMLWTLALTGVVGTISFVTLWQFGRSRGADDISGRLVWQSIVGGMPGTIYLVFSTPLVFLLVLRLHRYLRELRLLRQTDRGVRPAYDSLFQTSARIWKMVGLFVILRFGFTAVTIYDEYIGFPSFSMEESSVIDELKEASIQLELRAADTEPHEGWAEHNMTRMEPVVSKVYVSPAVDLELSDIQWAHRFQAESGDVNLWLRLTAKGAERLRSAVRERVSRPMAIMVNGHVRLTPIVSELLGRDFIVRGMDAAEVEELAYSINESIGNRSSRKK